MKRKLNEFVFLIFITLIVQNFLYSQEYKLIPLDGESEDRFGVSVSTWEDYVVVGAPNDDDNGGNSGAVYLFKSINNSWIQEVKLVASDLSPESNFGSSVSIHNDAILIGAPFDSENGEQSGAAYIFRYDGFQWVEEAKIFPNISSDFAWFGGSVTLNEEFAIISAGQDSENGNGSGAVYIYKKIGFDWVEEVKLMASDGQPGDFFGVRISYFDNFLIIGASHDDDNGENSGAAYIFEYEEPNWIEKEKITASDAMEGARFGWSVSINNGRAIVGAHRDDSNGEDSGAAYLYEFDNIEWGEVGKILSSDNSQGDNFGRSVSFFKQYIVVSAAGLFNPDSFTGVFYLYLNNGGEIEEISKISPTDGEDGDLFGGILYSNDSLIIVGASGANPNGDNSGAAYIYNMSTIVSTELIQDANSDTFKIFPNPTSDYILCRNNSGSVIKKLSIIDSNGKIVKSISNCNSISVYDIPEGLYLISAHFEDYVFTSRVLILK